MLSVSSSLNVTDAFKGAQAHNTSRQAATAAKIFRAAQQLKIAALCGNYNRIVRQLSNDLTQFCQKILHLYLTNKQLNFKIKMEEQEWI